MKIINILNIDNVFIYFHKIMIKEKDKMYYQETYRPQVHFTPEKNWMNDPNGLVYYQGEYHLFYQYNPFSNDHDNMHWGHAVSTDLYHWEHLDIALEPDGLGTIFSGSAVVDHYNTSGLFKSGSSGLVAIFTHDGDTQQQSIAYSDDNGRTWNKYKNNPVIPNKDIIDFRDPKVFWHTESSKWIMSLACGDHIQFYGSLNLIDWTYLSSFGKEYPSHVGIWECPDLLNLQVEGSNTMAWTLIVSINADGLNGGSAVYYFTGHFDGNSFHPNEKADDPLKWADSGKDFYAAVSWDNTAENTYWIGWMNNWQYAEVVPVSPWRSAMSLARRISLIEKGGTYLLKQQPVIQDTTNSEKYDEKIKILPNSSKKFEINSVSEITMSFLGSTANTQWGINFITSEEEVFRLSINASQNEFTLRRTEGMTHFSKDFPKEIGGSLHGLEIDDLKIVMDTSSLELFFNQGVSTAANIIFPKGEVNYMEVWSESGPIHIDTITRKALASIWK